MPKNKLVLYESKTEALYSSVYLCVLGLYILAEMLLKAPRLTFNKYRSVFKLDTIVVVVATNWKTFIMKFLKILNF